MLLEIHSIYTLDGARISVLPGLVCIAYLESIERGYESYEDCGVGIAKYDKEQKLFLFKTDYNTNWNLTPLNSIRGALFYDQMLGEPKDGPIVGHTIEEYKNMSRDIRIDSSMYYFRKMVVDLDIEIF